MFWLGLGLVVSFVPGWTGAAIPTSWAFASIVLPLALWRPIRWTPIHTAIAATLAYACVSTLWSISGNNVIGLWKFFIFGLAFWLGSSLVSMRALFRGLAVGLAISSGFAVAQSFGLDLVLRADPGAGLLYNSIIAGLLSAMVIVGLVVARDWIWILLAAPALWLAGSRGGWLVLAVGLAAIWFRRPFWIILTALAAGSGIVALGLHPGSDSMRLAIWSGALSHLSWFGKGPEAFLNYFMQWPGRGIIQPEYVHNDYLQLVFEYGLGAAPILLAFAVLFLFTRNPYWPLYVCFATAAGFVFPLHMPSVTVLSGIVAGRVATDWHIFWVLGNRRRPVLAARPDLAQPTLA